MLVIMLSYWKPVSITFFHHLATAFPGYVFADLSLTQSHDPKILNQL